MYSVPERSGPDLAGVRDDDPHGADFYDGLLDHLDRREETIHVIRPFDEHLELPAAEPAGRQEPLGVLKVVVVPRRVFRVVADDGGDDLPLRKRRTVVRGDYRQEIVAPLDHDGAKAVALDDGRRHAGEVGVVLRIVENEPVDGAVGDDDELGEVDGVGPLAEDAPLRAALATGLEEAAHVLEVLRPRVRGEGLHRRELLAVAREDVAEAPLGNGHQGHHVDAVLNRHQEMDAAAEDVGKKPGFAAERDETRTDGAACAPPLLDDPHAGVGDDPEPAEDDEKQKTGEQEYPCARDGREAEEGKHGDAFLVARIEGSSGATSRAREKERAHCRAARKRSVRHGVCRRSLVNRREPRRRRCYVGPTGLVARKMLYTPFPVAIVSSSRVV